MTIENTHTHEAAERLGSIAAKYWTERGAIGVGFRVYLIPGSRTERTQCWTYELTGMNARGLPLNWPKKGPKHVRR